MVVGYIDEARQTTLLQVLAAVTGQTDFRTEQSEDATVEQNGVMQFWVSLFSISTGALAAGDIDIASVPMTAVMSRSRAGGAFNPAGITPPVFAKGTGKVSCAYQFLLAEWQTGDIYRLVLSGIKATVGGDVVFVPDMVWSNEVLAATSFALEADLISQGTTDFNATAKASIKAQDDSSLDTIVPATPTAGALTDILSKAGGANTFNKTTDSLEAIADTITALSTDVGTVFSIVKSVLQSTIVAAGIDLTLASTGGALELIGAYIQNGGTAFSSAGGAIAEMYTNNVRGSGSFFTMAEALGIANCVVGAGNATLWAGVILELGKKISIKATVTDFTSGGTADIYLVFRRLAAGATIAAA